MIRKDVKLGLAVGGVLLAVLVVYVLVVPDAAEPGAELALEGDAAALVSPDDASVIAVEPAPEPAPVVTATPNIIDAPGAATPDGADGADPFANPADDPAFAARRANGWDWGKLLDGEVDPLTLMSESTTPVGSSLAQQPEQVTLVSTDPAQQAQQAQGASRQPVYASGARPASGADPAAAAAAGPSVRRTHVVQAGETLSSIARAAYGRASYFPHILRANPGIDPKRLRAGDVITLPGADEVRPAAAATTAAGGTTTATTASQPQAIDAASEYRVESGDSLYTISMKLYGRGDRLDALYELNRDTIGPNKNALKVGAVLRLPAAPTR